MLRGRNEHPVVIVGAGPTGITLAAELCRRGVQPLVLDRLEESNNTSRAAVIHARTLEVLKPLGLTTELLVNGLIVPVFRVRNRDNVLTSISFKDLPTEFPYTLMCPQNVTESILLHRLKSLGGSVVRPCEVTAVCPRPAGVELEYEAQGQKHTVSAKWLVGCDGGHSVVRQQASIAFEGSTYEESFILADVRMNWAIGREEVSLFFSDKGLVVVAPLPEDRFRIVATVARAAERPSIADFEQLLIERGPTVGVIRIDEMVWSSRFRVSHKVAQTFRKGNVLVAGDAAHVHSPAGGQGMNTGIQDAVALAESLTAVLSGGDVSSLDEWARTRRDIACSIVQLTDRMTKVATATSPAVKMFRDAVIGVVGHLPFAQNALAAKLSELGNK